MSKKSTLSRRKSPTLPALTVRAELSPLDGTAALAVVTPLGVNVLVNSDVWQAAHEAAERLFVDHTQAFREHSDLFHVACGDDDELHARLEAAEWAHWHRLLQAAYIIGITVGQRLPGGAR